MVSAPFPLRPLNAAVTVADPGPTLVARPVSSIVATVESLLVQVALMPATVRIQFVQRGSVIFATMFVYDQFNIPIWYTATLNSVGNLTWTGDLLLTAGDQGVNLTRSSRLAPDKEEQSIRGIPHSAGRHL